MIRIAIMSSALSLTACGHYQYLEQNNQTSQANNRYSQSNVVFTGDNSQIQKIDKKDTTIKAKEAHKSTSLTQTVPELKTIARVKTKPIETNNKDSFWNQLVEVFTPEKVKPWQKSKLAKATMKPGGLTPGSEKFNQKIYSSKESSRGGLGVAGGGCGCN
jgi:ubiquitin